MYIFLTCAKFGIHLSMREDKKKRLARAHVEKPFTHRPIDEQRLSCGGVNTKESSSLDVLGMRTQSGQNVCMDRTGRNL